MAAGADGRPAGGGTLMVPAGGAEAEGQPAGAAQASRGAAGPPAVASRGRRPGRRRSRAGEGGRAGSRPRVGRGGRGRGGAAAPSGMAAEGSRSRAAGGAGWRVLRVSSFRQPAVRCLRWIPPAHVQVEHDDEQRHECQAPPELQPREPHDSDVHEPHPLEHERRRPDQAHREALREAGAEERGGEAGGDDGLQEPVQLALDAGVVGGVDVEHEELLRVEERQEERAERAAAPQPPGAVEVRGGAGVEDERGVDDGVLVVGQARLRYGAVGVERHGVAEHLGDEPVGAAGEHDEELEVADAWRREPGRRDVGARVEGEEPDVVEQLPQAEA
ncbi:hypothetical protein SETIT_5G078400v2 [Setaria italica]|uniref:Uncharacterized protein n=1 Tax=Setaria italica TaxID=4555 RepID=A0A368R2N8_SETIT|nr:hypothetical protein SETIT_5G078400v2 [Setaria italica]